MSIVTIADRWGLRGGTAADLATVNEIPLKREAVIEDDTGLIKVGDGVTHWNSLPYINKIPGIPCLQFTTDTGSTADSDPGAGLVKWNNATQSSASKLFFDDATADTGTDLSALFTELAASSTTGILHMVALDGAFKLYKWTGIADGTSYFKFTVSHLVSSGGNFADGITVRVAFYPIGLIDAPSDGSEYVRKDGAWSVATGGGGGGSTAWTLLNDWDFATDGAMASIEASLSGYNEVQVVVKDVTLAAAGYRAVQVSSNGGTSYPTSYDYVNDSGIRATFTPGFMFVHNATSASARTGIAKFSLVANAEQLFTGNKAISAATFLVPAFGTKPNYIKVGGWTAAGVATNMTGGKVFIYAR